MIRLPNIFRPKRAVFTYFGPSPELDNYWNFKVLTLDRLEKRAGEESIFLASWNQRTSFIDPDQANVEAEKWKRNRDIIRGEYLRSQKNGEKYNHRAISKKLYHGENYKEFEHRLEMWNRCTSSQGVRKLTFWFRFLWRLLTKSKV